MLVLLPPSETKRPGGDGEPWGTAAAARVRFASLVPQRIAAIEALIALSSDPALAMRVLKLSERQRGEVEVNGALLSAPTMPAIDRYTGVLFDALDASSLDADARAWLGAHVAIHSAPFGPVGALDEIPAYRLGAGSSVPGVGSAKRHWAAPTTAALAATGVSFVLDLRSEAYGALGPVPEHVESAYVRVVARAEDGQVRALNHFNKKAKGELVRRLAETGARISDRAELMAWSRVNDLEFVDRGAEIELVTEQIAAGRR